MQESVVGEAIGGTDDLPNHPQPVEGSADSASPSDAGSSHNPELRVRDSVGSTTEEPGRSNSSENVRPSGASQDYSRRSVRCVDGTKVALDEETSSSGSTASFFSPMPSLVALDEGGEDADRHEASTTLSASSTGDALVEQRTTPDSGSNPSRTRMESRIAQSNSGETPAAGPAGRTTGTSPPTQERNRGIIRRTLIFLGFGRGNERRKEVMSLVWTCVWCSSQVCTLILTLQLNSNTLYSSSASYLLLSYTPGYTTVQLNHLRLNGRLVTSHWESGQACGCRSSSSKYAWASGRTAGDAKRLQEEQTTRLSREAHHRTQHRVEIHRLRATPHRSG